MTEVECGLYLTGYGFVGDTPDLFDSRRKVAQYVGCTVEIWYVPCSPLVYKDLRITSSPFHIEPTVIALFPLRFLFRLSARFVGIS